MLLNTYVFSLNRASRQIHFVSRYNNDALSSHEMFLPTMRVRSNIQGGFVYESSEIIEKHSADNAVLRWAGQMMGLLPKNSPNQSNITVKLILFTSQVLKSPSKSNEIFSGWEMSRCQDVQILMSMQCFAFSFSLPAMCSDVVLIPDPLPLSFPFFRPY